MAGDLADLPVGARAAVLIERRNPGAVGDLEDRGAHSLAQFVADGELDPALAGPVQQIVALTGGVDAQQQLDVLDVLDGYLLRWPALPP